MTTLADLYDADKRATNRDLAGEIAPQVHIPHPLHGVEYADGVILCGVQHCRACREYKAKWCAFQSTDPWDGYCRCDLPKHSSSQPHRCKHGPMH